MQTGFLKEHSAQLVIFMRGIDLGALCFSGFLSYLFVFNNQQLAHHYQLAILVAILFSFLVYPFFSPYRAWRGTPIRDELRTLLFAWSTLFICLTVLAVITKTSESYSRLWLGYWFTSGFFILVIFRIGLRYGLRSIRALGRNQRQIVIIGSGDFGLRIAHKIQASPWTGLEIVGLFKLDSNESYSGSFADVYQHGGISEAVHYINQHAVDQVWIAISLEKAPQIQTLMNELAQSHCDIRYVPDIFSFQLLNHSISEIAGLPVMNLSVSPMEGLNRIIKAIEDRSLALAILLLISPVMALLALGVKLSSSGPVFYLQERVGWNGQPFKMIKFRSMPVSAEHTDVCWGNAATKTVGGFGRFIRKTSLDELPQFINVLRGEMSIVGPRPERPQFVEQFKYEIPRYMQKHKMKAGITGWAQINGWRGDTDLETRIEHDLYYIENWSLGLDLKIIFLTLFKGFIHKNAR